MKTHPMAAELEESSHLLKRNLLLKIHKEWSLPLCWQVPEHLERSCPCEKQKCFQLAFRFV